MRYIILTTLLVLSLGLRAQSLKDINFSYQYNPNGTFDFDTKPVHQGNGWLIFFKIQIRDTTTFGTDQFSVQWEIRSGLTEKEGVAIDPVSQSVMRSNKKILTGKVVFNPSQDQQVLVAKVINNTLKQLWVFPVMLESNYPVSGYLQSALGDVVFDTFINGDQVVSVRGYDAGQPLVVSYYDDIFPTAAPAFSEGQARVSKAIKPDSTFQVSAGSDLKFEKKGLYLLQKDTSATEGLSFRVEDGYPKFRKLEDLVGPFIYVCTKQEFDKLLQARNDKKQFDRTVISITQDAQRAKSFMRNYFRRAEIANQYFTSYKEGWKTDRGMIYIIFGPPDQVFKFFDREVWAYGKTNFNFVKSSTLFDPDNYVLVRDKKFVDTWYETVDLIRNGRFSESN